MISIDFWGGIANSIRFRSRFSYRLKTALTMNIQALQGRLLDAPSVLLYIAAASGRCQTRWMATIAHSHEGRPLYSTAVISIFLFCQHRWKTSHGISTRLGQ